MDWILGYLIQRMIQNVSTTGHAPIGIPITPVVNQRAITSRPHNEPANLDAPIGKVREAIEQLRELRVALISATVTGRIDVHEEVLHP